MELMGLTGKDKGSYDLRIEGLGWWLRGNFHKGMSVTPAGMGESMRMQLEPQQNVLLKNFFRNCKLQ